MKENTVIKKADKGSCVILWDCNDYITEAENNSPIKTDISRSVLKKKPCVTLYRQVIGSFVVLS